MNKKIAFIAALMMISALPSCSSDKEEHIAVQQSFTAEKLNIASYKKEKLLFSDEIKQVYRNMVYNNGNDRILLGLGTKAPQFWHSDGQMTEFTEIEFPEFDIGAAYDADIANDGTIAELVVHADYGDLPPVDMYDLPEGYDQDAYDAAAEYKFMIKTFSPDGKLLTAVDVTDFPVEPQKNTLIEAVYFNGEMLVAVIGEGFEIFGLDGKYLGELTFDDGEIDRVGHNNDGELVFAVQYEDGEEKKLKFCGIDSTGKLSPLFDTVYDISDSVNDIVPGNDEYSLFFRTRLAIFGLKSGTGEIETLVDMTKTGLNMNCVCGYYLADDGNMAVLANSIDYTSSSVRKYIPRSQEETDSMKVVTLGVDTDIWYKEDIEEWNDSGNDFTVEFKMYDSDYDKREMTADSLTKDVLSDDLPDMFMMFNDGKFLDVDLRGMGVFEDLYQFIDNDEVYDRDYFVPNVLECLEHDGKLELISDRFQIVLPHVAKKRLVGSETGWDIERRLQLTLDPPINWEFDPDTKYDRESYFLNWYSWIDNETMTCHFTDESFIKWLNFCNEPDIIEREYANWTSEEWEEYCSTPEFEAEMRESAVKEARAYIDDTRFISCETIMSYSGYLETTKGKFAGEELTFLEQPYIESFMNFGITKSSQNKDLAWQFLRSLLSDDHYKNTFNYAPLPITKTGLKLYGEHEKEPNKYISSDSEYFGQDLSDYTGQIYIIGEGSVIKIGSVDDDIISEVNDIIASAVPGKKSYYPEEELCNIAREEIDSFYHGSCTAEKCAEVLQNRVETYLSEHYD